MAKKFIDVMDTTFRDGFQSVFGARTLSLAAGRGFRAFIFT